MAKEDDNQNTDPQLSPPAENMEPKQSTPEEAKKELAEAAKGAGEILCEIRSTLQLFPITLTLDRAKISASKRNLLSTTSIFNLPIEGVMSVDAETGPLFGFIKITTEQDSQNVGPFWRRDTLKFTAIAQGYVVAKQRQIDLSALSVKELIPRLKKLGEDKNVKPEDSLL